MRSGCCARRAGRLPGEYRPSTIAAMSKAAVNFLVDLLLLLLIIVWMGAVAIVQFVFPPGTQAGGWTLWGRGYDSWRNIEFGCLAVYIVVVLVHLILHWSWVCNFVAMRYSRHVGRKVEVGESTRTLYGVATLIVILTVLGIVLCAAEFSVRPAP